MFLISICLKYEAGQGLGRGQGGMGVQTVALAIPSHVSSSNKYDASSLSQTKPGKDRKGITANCKGNQENPLSGTPEAIPASTSPGTQD